ncbi:MAG: DUF2182 domain-containing protein [Candidatus Marinimicrobia bacterium]|nr:DUF2182 domain-containing protein [Candidatus Neomarinimicrobiota bacterium]
MNNVIRLDLIPIRLKLMLGGSLLLMSAVAWIVSLSMLDGMAVEMLGFLLVWTVMMAAMMLPSVMPAVWLFSTVAQSRATFGYHPAPTPLFVAGYLGAWMLAGVGVALMNAVTAVTMGGWPAPFLGGALVIAGVYQLTQWKAICLGHCRAPIQFFMDHWHDGLPGALLMGAHHGLYCMGCCWGLMFAMIALGMMNPVWMGLIALLIFLENVTPWGERIASVSGVALIIIGAGIAVGLIRVVQ